VALASEKGATETARGLVAAVEGLIAEEGETASSTNSSSVVKDATPVRPRREEEACMLLLGTRACEGGGGICFSFFLKEVEVEKEDDDVGESHSRVNVDIFSLFFDTKAALSEFQNSLTRTKAS